MIKVISIDDILKILLALLFLVCPTFLLAIFLPYALLNYSLTGADLWDLKSKKNLPYEVIERLYDLKNKKYFFKYKLMYEVESKISNPKLFKTNEKLIENQISKFQNPLVEVFFLGLLMLFYFILYLFSKKLYKFDRIYKLF